MAMTPLARLFLAPLLLAAAGCQAGEAPGSSPQVIAVGDVHGDLETFRTLLASLGTLVKNRAVPRGAGPDAAFDLLTQPTPLQQRAFQLLGLPLLGM